MPTVGIPRALLYYQYYPMWRTFFEELGTQVVVSAPTTKGLLAAGSSHLVSETCLPTKVFCGHVLDLYGKADLAFVPAIRSLEQNVYNCSKFLGLPDLVQGTLRERPEVLTIDIDVNLGRGAVIHQLHKLGSRFTRNPLRIKRARDRALAVDTEYRALMVTGLTPPEAIEKMYGEREVVEGIGRSTCYSYDLRWPLRVAIVGHPYNVYDGYITHNLLNRLRSWGLEVVVAEMASEAELAKGTERLVGKPYWTFEDEVVGAAGHYLWAGVDGVITVVSFACGPDSVMLTIVQRAAKESGARPLLNITIDEHTGEAGLVTRLEAFVDMLGRRKYGSPRGQQAAVGERD
ncbi:MAG: acyl-CoA dehydratase activase-related protein [Dehalococcoidales bacterium]|nr:acyl-CoA dehydratase activase-related protein [Dehalococcoidales bacterium]